MMTNRERRAERAEIVNSAAIAARDDDDCRGADADDTGRDGEQG